MNSFYNFGTKGGAYFIRFNNESEAKTKHLYYFNGEIKETK
jgi:hypothetical protein